MNSTTRRPVLVALVATLATTTILGTAAGATIGRATAPTPDACLVALDEADHALELSSEAIGLSSDAVVAAAAWDVDTLNRVNADLDRIIGELGEPDVYLDSKAECRS